MTEFEQLFFAYILRKPELVKSVCDRLKPEYILNDTIRPIYEYIINNDDFCLVKMCKELGLKPQEYISIEQQIPFPKTDEFNFICYSLLENYKAVKIREAIESKQENILGIVEELKSLTFTEESDVDESEEFLKELEDRIAGLPDKNLVKTGFENIDNIIEGFRNSELIVIGARPSAGKTTLAVNLASNFAKEKKNVLFFSVEMAKLEMHKKLVESLSEIPKYKQGAENFDKIYKVSKYIKDRFPISVNDKAGISIEEVVFKSKLANDKKKLDAVFVDHLGILTSNKNFKSRYELITHISFQLKVLAKDLNIPVIALCQLSRTIEQREVKAPNMSDLRDSGSIEQDADLVCFIHNPEYYLSRREPDDTNSKEWHEWSEQMETFKGKAQLVISKNRRGMCGAAKLKTNFEISKFNDRYGD